MMRRDLCDEPEQEAPLLKLAREFDTAAKTLRAVRLFGPANDAEARRGACLGMAAAANDQFVGRVA